MPSFLIDEDLPRTLASALRNRSIDAVDGRDEGLRGWKDHEVLARAEASGRTVVTRDRGFVKQLKRRTNLRSGLVLVRAGEPPMRVDQLVDHVIAALVTLTDEDVAGKLVIIERERVHIRELPAIVGPSSTD